MYLPSDAGRMILYVKNISLCALIPVLVMLRWVRITIDSKNPSVHKYNSAPQPLTMLVYVFSSYP